MTIDQALIILSAFCLGLGLRPHITTFHRKAWSLATLGAGFGVLLAMRNASQLSPGSNEQAKVFVFTLAVTVAIIAVAILTMWFADRRRAT
jgi:hypothetical protein